MSIHTKHYNLDPCFILYKFCKYTGCLKNNLTLLGKRVLVTLPSYYGHTKIFLMLDVVMKRSSI